MFIVDENDNRHHGLARGRPLPPHISVGPVGRVIFGFGAFVVSLCAGGYAAFLAGVLIIGPRAMPLWKVVLAHFVLDVCTVASIFMLFLAISFWAGGSRRIDPLLYKFMPKGTLAVCAIVVTLLIVVCLAKPAAGIDLAAWFVVAFPAVFVILLLMQRRSRKRTNPDKW